MKCWVDIEYKERTQNENKALKDELMVAHWWCVLWRCNYSVGRKAGGKKAKGDEQVHQKYNCRQEGKKLCDEKI